MPYFCYEISENVYVKPFQEADEVSHGEYLLMRLMPELVIKLLQIYSWRFEEGDPPQLPYCCEKHGFIPIDKASIEFFDSCDQEDSVGDSFKFMFNRSLNSVFE
ncbi:MAG: hypothetical protein QJT81_02135 [Candidatus Thiothrix putei]|uniref:Uncharacterized protein n=1 Tax=Candidatus Thiothrix putei TaxID=3080811 RepID=A0AA95KN35_9GAMM|nr:MAG: hypothetical protein QJT81_02135 [Candidatus Thiothrix putei]